MDERGVTCEACGSLNLNIKILAWTVDRHCRDCGHDVSEERPELPGPLTRAAAEAAS